MRILRLYLSIPAGHGVGRSQVYNWAEILSNIGNIKTKIIVKDTNEEPEEIRQMIEFDPINTIVFKRRKTFLLYNILYIIFLAKIIVKNIKQYDKIIVQSRHMVHFFNLLKILPKVKTVYEIRGAREPILYKSKYSKKFIKKYYNEFIFRSMLTSNRIICVSNYMKNYYSKKYNLNENKIFVVYGAADEKDFFFDPSLREKYRNIYKLSDKTVYLYSGKIDKYYTVPEKIFELFSVLKEKYNNLFFVVITPNIVIAEKFKIQYRIDNDYILIKEARYSDLNKYYNMADFGLLLRPKSLINQVASPTKFSEYMLCGLPCVISDNVGDFSGYIKTNNYGLVIPDLNKLNELNYSLTNADYNKRKKISAEAKKYFSKQSYIKEYIQFYKSI